MYSGVACLSMSFDTLSRSMFCSSVKPKSISLLSLNRAAFAEAVDLRGAIAELGEDLVRLLAVIGRARHHLGLGTAQAERLANELNVSQRLRRRVLDDTQMLHLRIGEGLVNGINRPAGNAGLVHALDQRRRRLLLGDRVDQRIKLLAILASCLWRRVVGMIDKILAPDRHAETFPHRRRRRDVDMAVAGLEGAGGRAGRVIVADLARQLAFHQIARALEIEHEKQGFKQRGLDPLALP